MKRIFLAGIPPEITETDLTNRFKSFGLVTNCEFKTKNSSRICFFDLQELNEFDHLKLIKLYNNTKWKQQILRVQVAQLDFRVKLQRELDYKPRLKLKFKKINDMKKFKIRIPSTGRQVLINHKKFNKHKRF